VDASSTISAIRGPAKWGALALLCALAGGGVTYALLAGGHALRPPATAPATPVPSTPAANAPAPPATAGEGAAPIASPAASRLININTAPAAELELLPGIGPALARRIIEHRATHGPFKRVRDLDAVKGIGPRTVEHLEPLARVE
jgi:competence protein ComEA